MKEEATMQIEAVIWDLGGVLVRTMDRSRRSQWERQLQLDPGDLDRLVFQGDAGRAAALGKAQATDIWQELRDRFNLSIEETKRLEKDFWAGDEVDQSLISLIRTLRQDYKSALLSNAWLDLRHALETLWGIADAFDEIIISAEIGLAKPDPRIYRLALERLEITADQAVFIDDFKVNIDAANEVGMHTIHFTSTEETRARLLTLMGDQSN